MEDLGYTIELKNNGEVVYSFTTKGVFLHEGQVYDVATGIAKTIMGNKRINKRVAPLVKEYYGTNAISEDEYAFRILRNYVATLILSLPIKIMNKQYI